MIQWRMSRKAVVRDTLHLDRVFNSLVWWKGSHHKPLDWNKLRFA